MRKNSKGEKIAFILYSYIKKKAIRDCECLKNKLARTYIYVNECIVSEPPTQKVFSLFKAHRMNIYAGIKTEKVRTAKNQESNFLIFYLISKSEMRNKIAVSCMSNTTFCGHMIAVMLFFFARENKYFC